MAYSDKIIEKINDKVFLNRCRCEFFTASIAVQNELSSTANYFNRSVLAKTIIYNRLPLEIMAHAIMTNPTIQAKIELDDDTYIDDFAFAVGSVFDSIANSHAFFNGV